MGVYLNAELMSETINVIGSIRRGAVMVEMGDIFLRREKKKCIELVFQNHNEEFPLIEITQRNFVLQFGVEKWEWTFLELFSCFWTFYAIIDCFLIRKANTTSIRWWRGRKLMKWGGIKNLELVGAKNLQRQTRKAQSKSLIRDLRFVEFANSSNFARNLRTFSLQHFFFVNFPVRLRRFLVEIALQISFFDFTTQSRTSFRTTL